MDLISVVIPVYNVEGYLRQCVDSVITQTYVNLQIILVDDGSTDSSGEICDNYLYIDSRVQVVHKVNGGLSDARNVGIEIAKGRYITFIDSDDVISSDMLQYLYDLISEDGSDISVCQRLLIDETGKIINSAACINNDYTLRNNNECMHDFLANEGIDTVAWGKLYKTSLFLDIRYPYGKYHEDVFTTYKIISLANRISIGQQMKYYYRVRKSSITQSFFSPKHLDSVYGKIEQANFIRQHYINDLPYALSAIVYSANQCVRRIAQSSFYDATIVSFLQSQFNNNEWYYLRFSHSGILAKLHSLCCYFSVYYTIKLEKLYYKIESYVKQN